MIIRNIVAVILWVFVSVTSLCQNVDSLKESIAGKTGEERIDALFDLSFELLDSNRELALKFGLEGYNLSQSRHDSLRFVRAGLVVASALRALQRIDSAIVIYQKITGIASKNNYTGELAMGLASMGVAHFMRAEYDKALACSYRAFELRQSFGDVAGQIRMMINIGTTHYKLKNYKKALDIFSEALARQRANDLCFDRDLLLLNIGHAQAFLGNYRDALHAVEKGLDHCGDNCGSNRLIEANFVRGVVYFGLKEASTSELYFLRSFEEAKEQYSVRFQLDNIDYLSRIYLSRGQLASALRYLEIGEGLIKAYPSFNLETLKIFSRLADLFIQAGQFQKASYYQSKYIQLKERVYNEELTNNLIKVEADYLERENLARISAQLKILALNDEVIAKQKWINMLAGVFVLLIGGFVVFLYRNFRLKRNLNQLLEKKVAQRTRELEWSRNALGAALSEKDLIVRRISRGVVEAVHTLQGLGLTAEADSSDSITRNYLQKVDLTCRRLKRYLPEPAD